MPTSTAKKTASTGRLCDYATTQPIREATQAETAASIEAARTDGGAGVIEVAGRRCYVEGGDSTKGGAS